MKGLGSNLFKRIIDREIITPFLERSIQNENWPDEYTIKVDSRPYYGNGDGKFHPSTHALMEQRKLYYVMMGEAEPEKFSLETLMTFAYGDALHAIIQTHLQMSGISEKEDIEKLVESEEHMGRGKVDAFVNMPDKRWLVDIKSMNSRSFSTIKSPYRSWVAQVSCYMDWSGEDHEEAIVLAVEKDYPHRLKEFRVKKDQELLDEIYAKWARVRKAMEKGTPPLEKCCMIDSATMSSCPARESCLETY